MEQRTSSSGREERPEERLDRNLLELLNELRVALPGVQVLFAFLLVVPFNQRFTEVTPFEEKIYFATLIATALASIFLIAPSVHHRLQFRRQEKEFIVKTGNKLALVGLAFLAIATVGVILLVTSFLFSSTLAVGVAGALAIVFAIVWYAIPLAQGMDPDVRGG